MRKPANWTQQQIDLLDTAWVTVATGAYTTDEAVNWIHARLNITVDDAAEIVEAETCPAYRFVPAA